MKRKLLISLMALFLILSGCSINGTTNETTAPATSEAAPTTSAQTSVSEGSNPYNTTAAADNDHVYYSTVSSIYRVSSNGSTTVEKIVDGRGILTLALHKDYIYYNDLGKLHRVGKDGSAPITYDLDIQVGGMTFVDDTVYFKDGWYADIDNDPNELVLKKLPTEKYIISPNGKIYSVEAIEGMETSNLYEISSDTGEKKLIIEKTGIMDSLFTDASIITIEGDGLYRYSLEGKNREKISDHPAEKLRNYSDGWLYVKMDEGLKRIHLSTHEEQTLDWVGQPLSVANGYLYGVDESSRPNRAVRMRLPDGEKEYLPLD